SPEGDDVRDPDRVLETEELRPGEDRRRAREDDRYQDTERTHHGASLRTSAGKTRRRGVRNLRVGLVSRGRKASWLGAALRARPRVVRTDTTPTIQELSTRATRILSSDTIFRPPRTSICIRPSRMERSRPRRSSPAPRR